MVVNALLGKGYRLLASLEQEQTGRLATVRPQCPGEDETGIVIDLLFASSEIEPELVDAADDVGFFLTPRGLSPSWAICSRPRSCREATRAVRTKQASLRFWLARMNWRSASLARRPASSTIAATGADATFPVTWNGSLRHTVARGART